MNEEKSILFLRKDNIDNIILFYLKSMRLERANNFIQYNSVIKYQIFIIKNKKFSIKKVFFLKKSISKKKFPKQFFFVIPKS